MKIASFRSLLVLLALLSCCIPASAQEEENHEDHEALRELRRVYEKAANENNLDLLKPYLHKDFSVVMMSNREFRDFESLKKQWQITRDKIVGDGTYEMRLEPELSTILGDIAIARGDSTNRIVTGSGDELSFDAKWTAICVKEEGKWKILRGHGSLDPFRNDFVKSAVKGLVFKVAAGALFAGLVLGWLLRIWVARRKTAAA
jgi:ketosteroid isomerase-like protein